MTGCNVVQGAAREGRRHDLRRLGAVGQPRAVDRRGNCRWHQHDIAEHCEHDQREHVLSDYTVFQEDKQKRDLGHSFGHQSGRLRVGFVESSHVGTDERARELSHSGNHQHRKNSRQWQGYKG